jgi:hypothetical protein
MKDLGCSPQEPSSMEPSYSVVAIITTFALASVPISSLPPWANLSLALQVHFHLPLLVAFIASYLLLLPFWQASLINSLMVLVRFHQGMSQTSFFPLLAQIIQVDVKCDQSI